MIKIDGKPLSEVAAKHATGPKGSRPVDRIHHDTIYREPEVCAVTGWSRSTLWSNIKKGLFDPPLKLGPKARGWLGATLIQHHQKLRAEQSAS